VSPAALDPPHPTAASAAAAAAAATTPRHAMPASLPRAAAIVRPLRRAAASAVVVCLAACTAPGFERAAALTSTTGGTLGLRGSLGMPRGRREIVVTQAAFSADLDGFFSIAGGVAFRARRGFTPRGQLGFGVGVGKGGLTGTCTVDTQGVETCKDGLGPFGTASIGLDLPLHENLALTLDGGGELYLNGDTLEHVFRLALGVAWK
jgi:hypothetical protein